MSPDPILRPEEVASVLAGDSGVTAEAPKASGPLPYSLREPVVLSPDAEGEALARLRAVAVAFRRHAAPWLGEELTLEAEGFQQQPAGKVLATLPPPAWVLAVGGESGGAALVLPPAGALALVEKVLGGEGRMSDAGRGPTAIESTILTRLLPSLARAAGETFGAAFAPAGIVAGTLPAAVASPGETVAAGLLRVRSGDGDCTGFLVASAALAAPRVESAEGTRPGSLARNLARAPFPVRAVLRAGRVTLGELSELAPGKILRLDAPEDALFDLRVSNRPIFRGRLDARPDGVSFTVARRVGGTAPPRRTP